MVRAQVSAAHQPDMLHAQPNVPVHCEATEELFAREDQQVRRTWARGVLQPPRPEKR